MNRQLKLTGFVLIGLAVAIILYFVQAFLIFEPLSRASGHSPESYLGIVFLISLPLSLFLGSGITGYFSSRHLTTKLGFLWVAPGLYFSLAVATKTIFDLHYQSIIPWFGYEMLQFSLLWFLVSWAGVGVGHLIKRNM
jgi:hypothetical protein